MKLSTRTFYLQRYRHKEIQAYNHHKGWNLTGLIVVPGFCTVRGALYGTFATAHASGAGIPTLIRGKGLGHQSGMVGKPCYAPGGSKKFWKL